MAWSDAAYDRAMRDHPRTKAAQSRKMKDFMIFCIKHVVVDTDEVGSLLAYMKSLVLKGLNFKTIINYLSTLKQVHARLGLSVILFEAGLVKQYIKTISKMKPRFVIKKGMYTLEQIDQLFRLNDTLPFSLP